MRTMSALLYAGVATVALALVLAVSFATLGMPASPATVYAVRIAAVGGFVLTLACCVYWHLAVIEASDRDPERFRSEGLRPAHVASAYARIAVGAGFLMLAAVVAYG